MIDADAAQLARQCWASLAERRMWAQGTRTYGKPDAESVLLGMRVASYVLTQLQGTFRDACDVLAAMDAAADEIDRCYEELFPEYRAKRGRRGQP
jgi:hypothetical protein